MKDIIFALFIIYGFTSGDIISCNSKNNSYYLRNQCSCYANTHIHCPKLFTATIISESVPSHMGIQCHSLEPLPSITTTETAIVPLNNIRAIVINDCVFSNHSILGTSAENLTDLSIYCKHGIDYYLHSTFFHGLNNLKLLHIWCPGLLNIDDPNTFRFISNTITHLTIRGSFKLTFLHEKIFQNMKNLVMLRIKDNPSLKNLPLKLFNNNLKQLKSLYLDNNSLHRLYINLFNNLEQLTDLSLLNNNLVILEPLNDTFTFEDEPKLVLLGPSSELSHALVYDSREENENIKNKRQINQERSMFYHLNSLTELKLDSNFLPVLKSINNLKKLRRISVRNCSISQLQKHSLDGLVNLEFIDLSLNKIHQIPDSFLQYSSNSLQTFHLTDNIASNLSISATLFSNLIMLKELNLSTSGLKEIPFNSFNDLKSLKIIDLSNNYINELPRLLFQNSLELEIIKLSNNILTNIPNDLLENLKHLKEFDISNNVLSRIPSNLFIDTHNLIKYSCNGNKLRTLNSNNLNGLLNLQYLDFSNNVIATADPELFSNMAVTSIRSSRNIVDLRNYTRSSNHPRPMTNNSNNKKTPHIQLKYLSLANNRLSQLPARIFNSLNSLEMLDLSNNSLTTLPVLTYLRELEELWLAGNRLRELPTPMFVDGSKLNIISLKNNFITDIPPSLLLGLGGSLRKVDASFNSITEFKSTILSGFESVENLDLSNNKLKGIDVSALKSLIHADFSHNALTFKDAGWVFYRTVKSSTTGQWGRQATFGNCTQLESVNLSNNSITDVLLDLRRLPSLRFVDLSYNRISSLESRDLQYGSSNITVDLRHNEINAIKLREDDLIPASAGRHDLGVRLLLDDNPMSCDCRLPNLLRYLFGDSRIKLAPDMHGAEIIAQDLTCYLPPSVRGKRLLEVETWGHYLLPLLGLCHVFN